MRKLLALDLSLNGTGMAYRDGFGVATTERITVKKLRGLARLSYVSEKVADAISYYGIDTVIVEDYAMGVGRGGMTFTIGELGGVIKMLAYERGMSVVLVSPATLKKYVTGKGNSLKEAMAEHALRRWGHSFNSEDECDAYCLLMLGERYFSGRRGPAIDWSTLRTERRSDSI